MDFWELMRLGGNVLDTPGSIGRGMAIGDPGRAFGGIFDPEQRVKPREVIDEYSVLNSLLPDKGIPGMMGEMGVGIATDPLTWMLLAPGLLGMAKMMPKMAPLARAGLSPAAPAVSAADWVRKGAGGTMPMADDVARAVQAAKAAPVAAKAAPAVAKVVTPTAAPLTRASLGAKGAPLGFITHEGMRVPTWGGKPLMNTKPFLASEAGSIPAGMVDIGPAGRPIGRLFSDIFKLPETAQGVRLHGIELEKAFRGMGLGQKMMVDAMLQNPNAYLYSSQMFGPGTRAMGALREAGIVHAQHVVRGGSLVGIPKKAVDIGPWYAILRHPKNFL